MIESPLADSYSQTVAQGILRLSFTVLPGNNAPTGEETKTEINCNLNSLDNANAIKIEKLKKNSTETGTTRSFEVLPTTDPGDGPLQTGWGN